MAPFKGPQLASCVASGTSEKQGRRQAQGAGGPGVPGHLQEQGTQTLIVNRIELVSRPGLNRHQSGTSSTTVKSLSPPSSHSSNSPRGSLSTRPTSFSTSGKGSRGSMRLHPRMTSPWLSRGEAQVSQKSPTVF